MGILNIHAIEMFIRQHNQASAHTTKEGLYLLGILNIHAIEMFIRQHNQASAHTTKEGLYLVGILNIHAIETFIDNIIKHLLSLLRQDFIMWE